MNLELRSLEEEDLLQYKLDMQEAFQLGALEGGYFNGSSQKNEELVLA